LLGPARARWRPRAARHLRPRVPRARGWRGPRHARPDHGPIGDAAREARVHGCGCTQLDTHRRTVARPGEQADPAEGQPVLLLPAALVSPRGRGAEVHARGVLRRTEERCALALLHAFPGLRPEPDLPAGAACHGAGAAAPHAPDA